MAIRGSATRNGKPTTSLKKLHTPLGDGYPLVVKLLLWFPLRS